MNWGSYFEEKRTVRTITLNSGWCTGQQHLPMHLFSLADQKKNMQSGPRSVWNKDRLQTQGEFGFHLNRYHWISYIRRQACRWGMGGVMSFDRTVSDNLD